MSDQAPANMKTVCAWCKRTIKEGPEDGPVSHGICAECAEAQKSEAAES